MKNNFVKYKDLLTIKEYDEETNKEEFVYLPLKDDDVIGQYQSSKNMLEYGEKIVVRKTIYEKLKLASRELKEYNKQYKLIVVYGFRDMKIQEKYFKEIYDKIKNEFDDKMEMYEYIHEKIAVPEVAGHPTGGAVDIAIYDEETKNIIDFGCDILDYSTTKCYYYSGEISREEANNRKLLRKIMTNQGFAPYDGEWWHFSYGDKEWAFYYKKLKALYKQMNAREVFPKINKVKYQKYFPGGNGTALIIGNDYSEDEKKTINDKILSEDRTIEQVGFLTTKGQPELQMAGGEFCGNATRSAAFYYLKGKAGKMKILVNQKDIINAGVYDNGEAWSEIPLYKGEDAIIKKEKGIYQVKMNGIVSIVINEDISKKFLADKSRLKEIALQFITKYKLDNEDAVGVIFIEKENVLKIHPVVWVRKIKTLYYETGCGSGSTATAMVQAYLKKENTRLEIFQPSGLSINVEIKIRGSKIIKAVIFGKVCTDNIIKDIDIGK